MGGRITRAAAGCAAIVMMSFLFSSLSAYFDSTVGKFMYRGNAENLNGTTIHVSDTMVALSSTFWAQSRDSTLDTLSSSETPSIMFLIDNSGSMMGNGGTDPNGYRYSIVRRFIQDTIFRKFPHAEVGLAVFATHLWFDPSDTNAVARYPFIRKYPLVQCLPQYQHDTVHIGAYVPLLQLDKKYYVGPNPTDSLTGLQLIDTMLVTSGNTPNVTIRYQPTTAALRLNSTNITAAFDAAKSAMTVASASLCSRYVIFLSDGVGNRPGGTYAPADLGVARGASRYFEGLGDSTKNVPTTFTVFFPSTATLTGPNGSLGLREIDTMTSRIRVNGYDTTKPADSGCQKRSWYWPGDPATLMTTLTNNIWKLMTQLNSGDPIQIIINDGTPIITRVGNEFILPALIPLHGTLDSIAVAITYRLIRDGEFLRDTTDSVKYWIQRMTGAGVWNPPKSSFDVWTWKRYEGFRYAGVPITAIAETMDSVELRFVFDSGTAKYGYDLVPVTLYNKVPFALGSNPLDREPMTLTRMGATDTFTVKFKRQVSTAATWSDGVLQYTGDNDTVVAIFRNQEQTILPLDTLRKEITFIRDSMWIAVSDTTITAGDSTNPILIRAQDALGRAVDPLWVMDSVTYTLLPATSHAGDAVVRPIVRQWARFTGTWADTIPADARRIAVALHLPNGTYLRDTMRVWVRPAAPSRLWLEALSTPDLHQGSDLGTVVFGSAQTLDTVYALLRDRFQNFVRFSNPTTWISRNLIVDTIRSGRNSVDSSLGRGILFKGPGPDSTWNVAIDNGTSLRDSIWVVVSNITWAQLRIMRRDPVSGLYNVIYQLFDTIPRDTTLYVQGYRSDGIGGWLFVTGTWSLSDSLAGKTNPGPTPGQSWRFAAVDTGSGTIQVSYSGVSTSIMATFIASVPNLIEIYPLIGQPDAGANIVWPASPALAATMSADSIFTRLYAKMFYSTGSKNIWLPQYENTLSFADSITWSVTPVPDDTLTVNYATPSHAELKARRAPTDVYVTATWKSLSYTVLIHVDRGAVNHLVVEPTSDVSSHLYDDNPIRPTIPTFNTSLSVYAILRDRWGDFVDYSHDPWWTSRNPAAIAVVHGDTTIGEGFISRVPGVNGGQGWVVAFNDRYGPTLQDSAQVRLLDVYYTDLRIYTMDPYKNDTVDTVRIAVSDSQRLYVEGQRSDDGTWEPVTANWNKDVALNTRNNPVPGITWNVIPTATGQGWIRASRNEPIGVVSDSVWAVFKEGAPASIALYRNLGDPATVPVFPATDTVTAGASDAIFAKIFDIAGNWLRRYEDTIALAQATIRWTIQPLSGPGTDTLSTRTGRSVLFSPHTAYTLYRITATFSQNGITLPPASANIYVKQGLAQHIVIEGLSPVPNDRLVGDYPIGTITLHQLDTVYTQLYAIVRDQFGNFVGYPSNPAWSSDNTAIVTAIRDPVNWQIGGGRIVRVTPGSGSAVVSAADLDNPVVTPGSVAVVLDSLSYDSLRIVQVDYVRITSLTLQSGQNQTVYVQAHRPANDLWLLVPGSWSYSDGTPAHSQSGSGQSWVFNAIYVTTNGRITVTYGNLPPVSIPVTITAGPPNSLVLYSQDLPPSVTNVPLANPPQRVTMMAGNTLTVAALLFDWQGVYLSTYDRSTISWSAMSLRPSHDILDTLLFDAGGGVTRFGGVKYFKPTRAYDTVQIIAARSAAILDTVLVVVQPGPVTHIVFEKSQYYYLNTPVPCDTLTIHADEQSRSVYAILRDAYGNVVAPGYATLIRDSVLSLHDSIGVNIPNGNIGELQALRLGLSDTGMMYAWDSHGYSDSCRVELVPYTILALRIVDASGTPYADGYTLTMSTNDSAMIYVQGLRSDTALWVNLDATWEVQPVIQSILASGRYSNSFMVSPTDTGTGWIRVSKGSPDVTRPDTLPLHFTGGCAVRATITILDSLNSLIAGRPIRAVDSLFDADGHLVRVPSLVVNPTAYHDTIGNGGQGRPDPFLLVGADTVWLAGRNPWDAGSQTFRNGVDTVTFTLYYAPSAPVPADSMHQIYATFNVCGGTARAHTRPFVLLPAPLSSIVVERSNGVPITGTVELYYNTSQGLPSITIYTRGYDQYHNNLGYVQTDWSVNTPPDSLHPIYVPSNSVTNIFYSVSDPTFTHKDEGGWIEAQDPTNPGIYDRVFVIIHGPLITLNRAITADVSGNGYLDRMTLYFSRQIALPSGFNFTGLKISSGGYNFTVDSVLNTGRTDSVWTVAVHEDTATHAPQTAWTPAVSIPAQLNAEGTRTLIADTTITAVDGAGPVIWSVIEHRTNLENDRTKDTVVVIFSEAVTKANGNILDASTDPSSMFYVWYRDTTTGTFIKIDNALSGIVDMRGVRNPGNGRDSVKFLMSNGFDLKSSDYLSINTDGGNYVIDLSRRNMPNANNQLVQVQIVGQEGGVIPTPNPAVPTIAYIPPGVFLIQDEPRAEDWVNPYKGGKGGAELDFTYRLPLASSDVSVECQMKIYDLVGNVVQGGSNEIYNSRNATAAQSDQKVLNQGLLTAHIYWNCTNAAGMVVAVGVYRVVVYLHYKDNPGSTVHEAHKYPDEKKVSVLGVAR